MEIQSNKSIITEYTPATVNRNNLGIAVRNDNDGDIDTSYSYDDDINMFVTKVKDSNSNVVDQIPTEDMIRTMKAIGKMIGNVVDDNA